MDGKQLTSSQLTSTLGEVIDGSFDVIRMEMLP
jgi:hypothetical protein